ncbi:MAG: helix-turn-helix transcriptional regulator [Sphingomonadales bacterium]|nr:helix-turn-helix transcriptional regulator [Sphingomonadales bacterium]
MINRIRDIRREKGLTLADVAARCSPPTTAQTIGRLETGTRQLSLTWMNRIASALGVDPQLLVRGEQAVRPMYVARLTADGAEALPSPREAILPTALGGEGALLALAIEAPVGQYRAGDQVWLRRVEPSDYPRLLNRDVLAPRSGGRFAFGRMIDRDAHRVAILPPDPGHRQVVVDGPAWLAVAEMLVRAL